MTRKRFLTTNLFIGLLLAAVSASALEIVENAFVKCYPEAGRCEVRSACAGCEPLKPLRVKLTAQTKVIRDVSLNGKPDVVVGIADVGYRKSDNVAAWIHVLNASK